MNWASTAEFFAMGGYALYVWGSFLAAAVCVTAEVLFLRTRRAQALRRVRAEKVGHEAAA